ncbi:exodeoxyribonuclease VII small subunit [Phaeodactylibacter sp.]|jgi:exodeoxyribonuclease VII small subunit|uniref:exodeoxyribonuclease VII small subunit n=1 Tax=Phaeodactylibacter sp. TaxID=1940289 RepID=UPI0025CB8E70|nr:exodeoxyribonuclease VII small subunit [Phaeodactylibacter sp.]MCI4648574.1 exodeoxyribonuclease VII small subunit [Phaeodactylibacter sp.]MCI5090981.1 exodeoxyribonuclease VII small subunit [Phaeodactylibacter sp.]
MNLTYEEAIQELQETVAQLQEDEVNIDELSAKVKRAAELIAYCREKLRATETEIGGLFEG